MQPVTESALCPDRGPEKPLGLQTKNDGTGAAIKIGSPDFSWEPGGARPRDKVGVGVAAQGSKLIAAITVGGAGSRASWSGALRT